MIALSRWVRPGTALAVIVALFLLASVWRGWVYHADGWERAYYAFDTRLSGLLLGAAFAWSAWRPSPNIADHLAGAGMVGLCLAMLMLGFYTSPAATWGGLLVDLAALALVAGALGKGPVTMRMLSHAPLVHIGLYSYSLYLWHYPIARLVRSNVDGYTAFAITFGISFALAWLTFRFIEQPVRQWARRTAATAANVDLPPRARRPAGG